ncbi:MAG TPA: MOSC N-terminal beta barrel domain-containing protein [Opitutaceae bacterium]|nr:MOSC N-terminal beta barrel domain-containing protein [Opitutaceae bacterium]
MELSGLYIFPVKGCRGYSVPSAEIDELGFVGDRRFMIIDEAGNFISQRNVPALATLAPQYVDHALELSCGTSKSPRAALRADHPVEHVVSVWSSHGLIAEDCGDEIAQWLSDTLHRTLRLVRIGAAFNRPVLKTAASPTDRVNFADACPFLVISEASLDELNQRIIARGEQPVPMDRFRPNVVVRGVEAFAEDRWKRFFIGQVPFRSAGPCARCIVTTTDQQTGERSKEPLRTLATYRRAANSPGDVNFGQNVIHEKLAGTLRVGDRVSLLSSS